MNGEFSKAAYSEKQWKLALLLSAIFGWLMISAPFLLVLGPSALIFAAPLGLPVAFLICWLIAGPALKRMMQKPISWLSAAVSGALLSFVTLLPVIIMYLWLHKSGNTTLGGVDARQFNEGVPTKYGWFVLAQQVTALVVGGTFIALLLRAIIGPVACKKTGTLSK